MSHTPGITWILSNSGIVGVVILPECSKNMVLLGLFTLFLVIFMVSISQTYKPNADLNGCYAWLQNQTNASLQILSANHTLYGDPSLRFFSLPGCRQLCGTGYQPWPINDIVDRFSLWLFPAFILLTHFNFAPLGVMNHLAVISHAVGDPIDSLWSILTRFEVNRRLLRTAEMVFKRKEEEREKEEKESDALLMEHQRESKTEPSKKELPQTPGLLSRLWTRIRDRFWTRRSTPSTSFEHIATIWVAYEELGWQDASRSHKKAPSLDKSQLQLIRKASYDLSSRRQASSVLTLVPILSLAGSLGLAVIKTVQQNKPSNTWPINETAHTIAVVCLLFIFIPLVAFSGSIGTASTVTAAVDTIIKLRRNLNAEQDADINALFPVLTVPACSECSRHSNPGNAEEININDWPRKASYMGMNSIWRPCKHIQSGPAGFWKNSERGKCALRFWSLLFVIAGASVPAVFLSATNRANIRLIGVGCRSLSWLTIMCCWLMSFADDWWLRRSFQNDQKRLWRLTIGKDIFCVVICAVLIAFEQIGVYNSCWCRASLKPYVRLQQYNVSELHRAKVQWGLIASSFFLFNLVITAWLMFVGGRATSVLCKSEDKLQADLEEISPVQIATDGESNPGVYVNKECQTH